LVCREIANPAVQIGGPLAPLRLTSRGAPTSKVGFATPMPKCIDPITISDAHSRYLLRWQALENTNTARVEGFFLKRSHSAGTTGVARSTG